GRLALVVLGQERWRPADWRSEELVARLAAAVRRAGGTVVSVIDDGNGPGIASEATVATAATSAFHGTGLDGLLRDSRRTEVWLGGGGPGGPAPPTCGAANARGYECLLVEDACEPTDPALVEAAFSMVMHSGGIFGAHAPAAPVLAVLDRLGTTAPLP